MIDITGYVLITAIIAITAFLGGVLINVYLTNKKDKKIPFKEDR